MATLGRDVRHAWLLMNPPADPWGETKQSIPRYGRASVPVPPAQRDATAELPLPYQPSPDAKPVKVSWEKVKNANRRRLSDGWGLTATGLIVVVSGWVVWAAANRGTGRSIWPGFVLSLVAAVLIFVVSRTAGYYVVERGLNRPRRHARWSHFFAGLFLTLAGFWYLVNTEYQLSSGDWLQDGWRWLTRIVGLD